MPLAIFPANPLAEKAPPAMFEAWLNLSQREKARELVIVSAMAIASIKSGQPPLNFPVPDPNGRTHQQAAAK